MPRRTKLAVALRVALAAILVCGAPGAGSARAAQPDDRCAKPGKTLKPVPWPQQALDPERVWPFSTGRGVTVAVLSSGVDGGAAQLRGHVQRGADFLRSNGSGRGDSDCTGLGTQIAGVIAAQPSSQVGFHGIAPGVQIVPVTVSDNDEVATGNGANSSVDLPTYAAAIRWAVGEHVAVLAIPAVTYTDDARVRGAVALALTAGIVVIAGAGTPGTGDQARRVPYPAAYPGVVGVGAVGPDGSSWSGSPAGEFVDLVAPGAQLISTQRGGGLVPAEGTDLATGFAAATAALVRARFPRLTPAQVVRRMEATATPAAGGPDSRQYGFGIVSPYGAVNDLVAAASPEPLPAAQPAHPDPVAAARKAAQERTRRRALAIGVAGLLLVVVVAVVAVTVPRGRRRRWRATVATPPPSHPEADLPSPPVHLFDDA